VFLSTHAWIDKTVAAAGVLVAALLAAHLSRRPSLALALVGWNPVFAVHFGGGGHKDSWLAALVLAALACGSARRPQLAGIFWALAALVEWVSLLLLPLRALEARATGRRVGHLGFAVTAALALACVLWLRVIDWTDPLTYPAIGVTLFALGYAWLVREALRGSARLGLAMALLVITMTPVAPWYVVWTLPIAAAEDDALAVLLGLALCVYVL
jgi:hypothetical protein